MKATEAKLLTFLKKSPQFVIPIYQRTYSWTITECQQLWDDIVRAGARDDVSVHFIGSIVYVEEGLSQVTSHAPLLVIDGQQRLTTLTIVLANLARAVGDDEPVDGFSGRKITNYYLLNPEERGDRRYKLLLTQTDRPSLIALVDGAPAPSDASLRVMENSEFFRKRIEECAGDFGPVCKGLAKLVIVDIALSRDHDNPQLIFESMNSTGKELSQADLIRNFVLMGLEPRLQTELYEQYWHPMERAFGQRAYSSMFDGFMRHYLTVKTGEIPNLGDVYAAFKAYAMSAPVAHEKVEVLVADLNRWALRFCRIALGQEPDRDLREAFHDLRELKVDVAYPFLLELYADYDAGRLTRHDFLQAIRLLEAYVFRRAICAIPTNSLNKTFANLARGVRKERYLESIKAHLLLLRSYRRFPDDVEFRRCFLTRELYLQKVRSYTLRKLENHQRKERVGPEEYTIEHILPQNENLSVAWRESLGQDWQVIHQKWLHTIGNLTLTGYNTEYSDRPFPEKRDMPGGFRESPLRLNAGLGQVEVWNEDAITHRGEQLVEKGVLVWAAPHLSPEVLEEYRATRTREVTYTIDDHHSLVSGKAAALFEAFRREVLELGSCVSEEFLKYYVAYKAETNFVDVYPQASRLRLILNLPFEELDDPENRCANVAGYRLNGEVKVHIAELNELPYVMGLIRQSFERQVGGMEA
ncbi:MAG TPA: DUF262 domain-containing protein [Gemmatimonas aurantiaca]|uniref:DUF262 domain-containing protein n=2 Tax=Gemmatimonas aurantiaca TaxID=173480 RepID=C1ADN9_GEMAT|nr:DUF262 and DUF1524 domain-containing protein [Gemmatimonas aurantiaca]BAH40616.1 hypothetical protein GAU_3574 [Gemmatimonas aurantiaca T-27]HCT56358.1 DUF262 domain-containing protein [Gemmatimonas aurantiaca]